MCNVTFFKQKSCNHTWAVITTPCGPYMDFSTCASFCGGSDSSGSGIKTTPQVLQDEHQGVSEMRSGRIV